MQERRKGIWGVRSIKRLGPSRPSENSTAEEKKECKPANDFVKNVRGETDLRHGRTKLEEGGVGYFPENEKQDLTRAGWGHPAGKTRGKTRSLGSFHLPCLGQADQSGEGQGGSPPKETGDRYK